MVSVVADNENLYSPPRVVTYNILFYTLPLKWLMHSCACGIFMFMWYYVIDSILQTDTPC